MDTNYLDSQTKFWHYLATSRKTNIKIYFEGLGFQTYLAKNCYNTLFCNKIGCGKQINLPIMLGMPSDKKSAVFFNIVQKAFAPRPPPPFVWTLCGEFFWRNFNKSA